MSGKSWLIIFVLQVVTVPAVIALFKFIPEKRYAAVVAGVLFIALGAYILFQLWKSQLRWRSLTWWLCWIHVCFSSIPLVIVRLYYFEKDFTQIAVFSVPGHVFHYYSQILYVAVLVATLVDWLVIKRFFKLVPHSVDKKKNLLVKPDLSASNIRTF